MPTVLITGASRGIGLEFARQYAADGWQVLACARAPAKAQELQQLVAGSGGQAALCPLDVDDDASLAALQRQLAGRPIDVLINNAGVIGNRGAALGSMDYPAFARALATNVVGPVRVSDGLLANLEAGQQKKLITITSRMGSLQLAQSNAMIYRASKAAVNMAMRCLSLDLVAKGVIVALLHPGWVKTDMGGQAADLTPGASVAALRHVIANLTPADNGRFINHDGTPIPW
ncbi:MAG: SDR family oxidoreductase [Alphaproteobacteria bacterium]|nr:SDR family oxidoreductase [Alphaproteobacteria bacterium]